MPTTDVYPQTQWKSLFFQLIHCLQQNSFIEDNHLRIEGNTKEIVLEVSSDGFSYVLTRTPSTPPQQQISLSPREKEIIQLVCNGLPNKAISDVLEISPWTVATYLKRIFAKLAVCTRAEMVARVLQDRLLE